MRARINIGQFSKSMLNKIEIISNREYLLRPVCFDLIALMRKRIHIDGKASDGGQIGTYHPDYLRLRISKKYNRKPDSQIIVSLTRQLENDWHVIPTARGYGIGFLNKFNYDKAGYVESIKKRVIFKMTEQEKEYAVNKLQELVRDALNS